MNLEEAKANIGKEVVLDESTKPYTKICGVDLSKALANKLESIECLRIDFVTRGNAVINTFLIDPKHLKLKEQPMQNYKIKVTPETSAEVQELFFELGYGWNSGNNVPKYKNNRYIHTISKNIIVTNCEEVYTELNATEITLPKLRDMVVLKRNDVGDATHVSYFVGHRFFVASDNKAYEFREDKWQPKICKSFLEPIVKQEPQMTWQDALRAVADGKDVEAEGFNSIKEWLELNIGTAKKFRLKPKTIHVDGGDYTKEELLKIVGEME